MCCCWWNGANLEDKVINCSWEVLSWERGHAERLVWPFQIIALSSIINENLPAEMKCLRAFIFFFFLMGGDGERSLGKGRDTDLKNLNDQILLWKKKDGKELGSSGMHCFTVKLLKLMSVSLFASLQHVFWHLWQFPSWLRIIFHLYDAPGIF